MHHSQALKNFPSGALKILQAMIGIIPHAIISGFFPYPASLGKSGKNRIIEYLANVKNTAQAYFNLAELFSPPQIKGLLSEEFYRDCQTDCLSQDFLSLLEDQPEPLLNKVVNLDLKRWLPDYTLMKQDRLAMANSLETRVPYLGHRLVEFCATLPVSLKISNRQTKSILRKSAINLLPKEFAYAKKRAFYFPTEKCFDENFGSFVKAVLLDNNSAVSRIFNRGSLEGFLKSYRKNELADNKKLLALVILNLWLKHYY
jgi:asparagine synthase (glutamine-hydrolysing)